MNWKKKLGLWLLELGASLLKRKLEAKAK